MKLKDKKQMMALRETHLAWAHCLQMVSDIQKMYKVIDACRAEENNWKVIVFFL